MSIILKEGMTDEEIIEEISLLAVEKDNEKTGAETYIDSIDGRKLLRSSAKEQIKEKSNNLKSNEIINVVLDKLRAYEVAIDKLDEARVIEESAINSKYNDKAIIEEKKSINDKYDSDRMNLKISVRKYVNVLVNFLEDEIDVNVLVGDKATSTEALNDLQLLEMLDEITKEEFQLLVNRYRDQALVLKMLGEIGAKHDLHISVPNKSEVEGIPKELSAKCEDFLDNYSKDNNSYGHRVLTTDEGNNGIDLVVDNINNFLYADVTVSNYN